MKKKLCLLLCLLFATICMLSGCRVSGHTIRFGAADIGGMYYAFANTFNELANEALTDYTFEVRPTAGSSANLRLLSDNYIELGIAQADLLEEAYEKNPNLRAIAALYPEACQIIVRADSDIHNLNDLSSHTVSIGAEETGTELNATQILAYAGLPSSLVKTQNINYTEAAKRLEDGTIDAMFCTAGLTTAIVDELSKKCDIRLLSLNDTVIEKMLSQSESYSRYTIPAGTYRGQDTDITTISVKAVLVTSTSMSEDVIEQLTRMLFDKAEELQHSIFLDLPLNKNFATENIPVPFHTGAVTYYEEQGLTLD